MQNLVGVPVRRCAWLILFALWGLCVAPALYATPPTPTITITAPPTVAYGQAFTITVTVGGVLGPGTGVVQLVIGGITYPPFVPLSGGTATFSIPGTQIPSGQLSAILPPAAYLISAFYAGDTDAGYPANYQSPFSASPVTLIVTPVVTVQSSANPTIAGSPIQLTAAINVAGGTPPTGTVAFFDGTTQLGTPVTVSNEQAVLPAQSFTAGNQSITAVYSGDSNYGTATSAPYIEVVGQPLPPPTLHMTLETSANPSVLGQSLAITASLVPSSGTPMGSVQFFDGSTLLGTVAVNNNQATLTTSALMAGSHTLVAQYSGDGTFPQASAVVGEVISPLTSTTTLTASASTVPAGQAVTFTAQVGPAPPAGVAAQTGQVLFQDTIGPIGTATLVNGTATLTTTGLTSLGVNTLPVGTFTINAIYLGDANWGASHASMSLTVTTPSLFLTNAATNLSTAFAPDETVSLFNVQALSGNTSGTLPLGTSLGGTTITITDSAGTARPALLYGVFASASQVNFVIPSGTATGAATLTVTPPSGASQTLQIPTANVAPGIFSASENGQGTFAGQIVIAHADGSQTVENSATAQSTGGTTTYTPTPISFAVPTDQVFLQLYGTGLRHASTVTATINGTSVTVDYAAAQGTYPGLDQVNLQVPSSLAGAGTVNIVITAGGQVANTVTTLIQ